MSNRNLDMYELAILFRALVAALEEQAVVAILTAYARLYQELQSDLDALLVEVAAIRARGGEITLRQAREMSRLQGIIESVEREVTVIAGNADSLITVGQRALVTMAQGHAIQFTLAGMGAAPGIQLSLNRIPTDVVETMVGFLRAGTPLGDALDRLPGMAAQDVRDALVRGVATGQHPTVVARRFREALGGNAASAERLARTAQLKAYQNALLETYRQNDGIVRRWRWHANLGDGRVCASCLVMHGREFPLDQPMNSHWNCRCQMLSVTATWSEILGEDVDIPEPPTPETGIEWFLKQPESVQRELLGRSKYHAWKAGEISLEDLSKVVNDPVWGSGMRVEASLKDLLGAEKAREWYAKAAELDQAVPA